MSSREAPGTPGRVLLNDAELAAIGVAERGPIAAPTLVLTVGFGIGGALVLPGDA